ncbi:MAG TPA: GAF domain-containing sensor histidine kinase [Anaerolineales bacterium]|nr:GAF domain-containing sensor histidine kinase [Anaerolineales bacterium]
MNSPIASSSPHPPQSIWINLARGFQVLVICLTSGLFIASIPLNYEQRSTVCRTESCPPGQLTSASEVALSEVGMSVDSLVRISIALDILVAVTYTICAVVIFVRKPDEPLTIFVSIMLVTFGTATFTGGIRGIAFAYPELDWLTRTIEMIGNTAILAFFFVFPNGRFTPRWTIAIFIGWFLFQLPRYYFPDSLLNLHGDSAIYNLLFIAFFLSGVAAQIYRYIRVSNVIERQQTKWVIYGLTIGMGGYLVIRTLSLLVSDPMGSGLLVSLGVVIAATFFILLIPISITIAVIRYRLWDINPIINRTLVYGALSASTIALYIFAVGFASKYFQGANLIISFIATGVIAILFEPLRERLQRVVNRLMYGERDDPTTVLTKLSQRLDSALAPDSVLQTIVETLAQTLRLPYAAISLLDDAHAPRFASTRNLPASELISLPLTYQTERVGELTFAPRAGGESFSTADMKLINIIAHQAGIAAYAVRLNNDLQRSRESLVTAREEERRRLRRDLHDGVGPTLASFSQRLDNAADLVASDPEKSVQLLKELKGQVKGTLADIRRLVYALRPPVLDEFGLVSAIREHVAQYAGPNRLSITFDVTESMPSLPAAVEVAAYRIVLEAFTNVVQHAEAMHCNIKLKLDSSSLLLEVSDDGKGLSTKSHAGIGLASIRERASELGGECTIGSIPSGGTRVSARLPVGKGE